MNIFIPMWLIWTATAVVGIPLVIWIVFALDEYSINNPSRATLRRVAERVAERAEKDLAEYRAANEAASTRR